MSLLHANANFVSTKMLPVCTNKETFNRVCTGPGNPGKSWNFILAFSIPGKLTQVPESPRNL